MGRFFDASQDFAATALSAKQKDKRTRKKLPIKDIDRVSRFRYTVFVEQRKRQSCRSFLKKGIGMQLQEHDRATLRMAGPSLVLRVPPSIKRALELGPGREATFYRVTGTDDLYIKFSAPAGEVSVTPERAAKKLSTKGKKGNGQRG